jgi:hypothetical protein
VPRSQFWGYSMQNRADQNIARKLLHGLPKAGLIGAMGVLLLPLTGGALLQQPNNPPRNLPEFINRLPDANDQALMRQGQGNQKDYAAVRAMLQKKISDDSAKLLKMATDLKTQVDKSGKETLSLDVIRKTEAIEKLARNIRGEVSQQARSN